MTRSRHEQPLLESTLTERSVPAAATLLRCRKCHAPFLDDTPQPHHPTVDIQALRSNILPSREIISQTHALIEAEMSDLNRLEETIRTVQDTLRELENRRDTLRREIQRRKSWGTPIRRFPVEVLQEIFTHVCLGDGRNQFSLDISSHVENGSCQCPNDCWHCRQCDADPILSKVIIATTVALSQVCFHWRSIIIASPSLWASLRLEISQMKTRHANFVKLYLRHSAQHPLKIYLRNVSSDRDFESEDSIEDVGIGQVGSGVVCSVMKELYRCREFYYEPDQDNLIGLVPEQCRPKGLPLLSSFSDRVHCEPSHVDRWFWDLVKVAPNLVDVSVEKFRADSFPKNLRNLTIKRQNYTAFLEMLSPCPKLMSLNLHDFLPLPGYGTLPPPPRTRHPIHTQKFTITTSKKLSKLDLLFSSVTLSSLSSLEIFTGQKFSENGGHTTNSFNRIHHGEASNFGALCALIQCSGCSLEDLTLHIDSYSSGDIISLLELQPSLAMLNLEVWVPRERVGESKPSVLVDLFARMSEPQSPLLPCVQHLDIYELMEDTGYNITQKYKIAASVLDMAESRERHGEPVPNISLTFDHDISGDHSKRYCLPNDLEQRVRELAARGVKCRIALPKVLSHCG